MKTNLALGLLLFSMATAQIPQNVKLWCLNNRSIPRSDFNKYTNWYREIGDHTQKFNFHVGDVSTEGRIHARLEMHSGMEWNPGSKWYVFQATYQIKTELTDDIAITQLFDYQEVHPQLMFILKDANRVTFQPRGKGNRDLGSGYNNKPFTIKIRSNGRTEEVFFNGEKRYSGTPNNTNNNARNGFRWGFYYHQAIPKPIESTMTNIFRGLETDLVDIMPPDAAFNGSFSIRGASAKSILLNNSGGEGLSVTLSLFGLDGKQFGGPISTTLNSGSNFLDWPSGTNNPGQYILQVKSKGHSDSQSLVLAR